MIGQRLFRAYFVGLYIFASSAIGLGHIAIAKAQIKLKHQ